jgi:hypothetical protein
MYADDIVLLSKSAEGMQEKLDKLSAFCTDWCLDINIKKTKILIFNKAGRHLSHKFVFQNNNLECVSRYKYLGIWFNNSGSFNFAQNELYQKALKALFKLKSDFLVHNPEVKTSIHVFDHYKFLVHLYAALRSGKDESRFSSLCQNGSVKHILKNMPSLTNFLTDKTSTFK